MPAPAFGDHPRCRCQVVRHWRVGPVEFTQTGIVSRLRLGPIVIDRVGDLERAYWAPVHFWAILRALISLVSILLAAGIWGWIISEHMLRASS